MNAVPKVSPAFTRFRESHHAVARMFATGLTISKVANETGYSRRRLQILLTDPSFQDLIAEYSRKDDPEWDEARDHYVATATASLRRSIDQVYEHLERAEESGELLPVRELVAIIKDCADRIGYSSKTVRVNVNADFAVKLDNAISRSQRVIEHQPIESLSHDAPRNGPATATPDQPHAPEPKAGPSLVRALGRA